MSTRNIIIITALVVVLGAVIWLLGIGAIPSPRSGEVMMPAGEPEAPQQSSPLSEAPKGAVQVTMSDFAVTPSSFTVQTGQPVTLSVTSGDDQTHIFKFRDPALQAVAVGVGPYETRAITFNAPSRGTYDFYCDVPGHEDRGETGTMTVR